MKTRRTGVDMTVNIEYVEMFPKWKKMFESGAFDESDIEDVLGDCISDIIGAAMGSGSGEVTNSNGEKIDKFSTDDGTVYQWDYDDELRQVIKAIRSSDSYEDFEWKLFEYFRKLKSKSDKARKYITDEDRDKGNTIVDEALKGVYGDNLSETKTKAANADKQQAKDNPYPQGSIMSEAWIAWINNGAPQDDESIIDAIIEVVEKHYPNKNGDAQNDIAVDVAYTLRDDMQNNGEKGGVMAKNIERTEKELRLKLVDASKNTKPMRIVISASAQNGQKKYNVSDMDALAKFCGVQNAEQIDVAALYEGARQSEADTVVASQNKFYYVNSNKVAAAETEGEQKGRTLSDWFAQNSNESEIDIYDKDYDIDGVAFVRGEENGSDFDRYLRYLENNLEVVDDRRDYLIVDWSKFIKQHKQQLREWYDIPYRDMSYDDWEEEVMESLIASVSGNWYDKNYSEFMKEVAQKSACIQHEKCRLQKIQADEMDGVEYEEQDFRNTIGAKSIRDAKKWLDSKLREYGNTYYFPKSERRELDRLIQDFGSTYFWNRVDAF